MNGGEWIFVIVTLVAVCAMAYALVAWAGAQ